MSESKLPRRVPLTKVDFAALAGVASHAADLIVDYFQQVPNEREQLARLAPPGIPARLHEIASVLLACRDAIETFPRVVMENRGAQVVETSCKIANALDAVAQKHDRGALPIVTPQTALREFAASLRKAVVEMQQPQKPRSKLEIVRA